MDASGKAAIKVIVVGGVVVFLFLMIASMGLRRSLAPNDNLRVAIETRFSSFDSGRAFADLRYLVLEAGPRPPGSPGADLARSFVVRQLRAAGLRPVVGKDGASTGEALNVYADAAGRMPATLVFAAPLSTPSLPGVSGANLTASPAAWLLEMARGIQEAKVDRTVVFAWLDGENAPDGEPNDGQEALVRWLRDRGILDKVQAVFLVGPVGDCHLNVRISGMADPGIAEILEDTAQGLGYGRHFIRQSAAQLIPESWAGTGLPVVALADTSYGASPIEHQDLWRTPLDNLDHVCAESLQAVADVVYHAVPAIEGLLNSAELGAS